MRKFVSFIVGALSIVPLASCGSPSSSGGKYHTVTFNSDGGTNIPSQKVRHGEKITKPEDPLKAGYIFDYWEYNQEKWSFVGYVVTEDITLLAKYNELTLDCPSEQTVDIDKSTSFAINVGFSISNPTITARSLDESIAVVKGVVNIDESTAAINMEAKQIGEVDVAVTINSSLTKTCHVTIAKKYLNVELYDIVNTYYASKSDPSVENVYLNKKVHFIATVSGCADYDLFLQRYNQKEDKYYGIMLYSVTPIPSKYIERGTLVEIYGTVTEYDGVCEISGAYFPTTSTVYSNYSDCKVIKTASENTDALTKFKIVECSASEFNSFYLSNDIMYLNMPIKITETLKIKTIENSSNYGRTIYYFDGYDFNLYATTIQDAAVGDYLKINYSVVFPTNKALNNTFRVSEDIVLDSDDGSSEDPDAFKPSLDVNFTCEIRVYGDYSSFEALEDEFAKFNEFYPNVVLSYQRIDNYTNSIGTVLDKTIDAPNIFFSYANWMGGDERYDSVLPHMEDLSDPALKLDLDCIRPNLLYRDASSKVVMIPLFSRTYGALVNTDLFKKENIDIPTKWSELISACEAFKNKEYKSPIMGYSAKDSSCLMNTVAYPEFVAELAKSHDALNKANNLDPIAGEYMRGALTKVKDLIDTGAIDINECDKISDNYQKVILRFFEGDVPMMICTGDTVSGTRKRESQSEAFKQHPFEYSFIPIPVTDEGGYFIDSPSVQLSVNKDCENLDMTNEFMRFLIREPELNAMAALKRLVTPTTDLSYDPIYAAFSKIPAERTFCPESLGIKDPLAKQIGIASFKVGRGELTIDEAIANYGLF